MWSRVVVTDFRSSPIDVGIPLVGDGGGGPLFLPVRRIGVLRSALGGDLVHLGGLEILRQRRRFAALKALFDGVGDGNFVIDRVVGCQFGGHGRQRTLRGN